VATGEALSAPLLLTDDFPAVAFSPDGRFVALTRAGPGGKGDQVFLWEPGTGGQRELAAPFPDNIGSVEFSPDGKLLLVSQTQRPPFRDDSFPPAQLDVLDVQSGKPVGQPLKVPRWNAVSDPNFFARFAGTPGLLFASVANDADVRVLSFISGEPVATA